MAYNGREDDVIDRLRAWGLRPACHVTPLADAALELPRLMTEPLTRSEPRERDGEMQAWG